MRNQLTQVRKAIIQNCTTINAGEGVERGNPLHGWWGRISVHPLWTTLWRFIKTLNIQVPCDPAIPLLGMDPEKNKL